MSQWGQAQQGFQYPLQTGFQPGAQQFQQNPQFPQQGPQFRQQTPLFQQGLGSGVVGGLVPQQTGFPGQRPGGFQQSQLQQPPQQSGFLQPQPSQQSGFLQPQLPQQTGFLQPQPTSFLQPQLQHSPQQTGFIQPQQLQMMSNTFMPLNNSAPYGAGGVPQLAPQQLPGGLSLQQSFQQHNLAQKGTATPKVTWTLTKAEKKNYDSIFRAWDSQGTGFISGQVALEVFGQSGLDKQDLARIWTLADIDDRGKLNMAEFHVAMGLIFRRLSGNDIPEQLPPELVPPSSRDLDNSVDFLKKVLANESRSRSPSSIDTPVSRMKERSFNGKPPPGAGGRQDATVYKHTDTELPGGVYQSRSRHVDREAIRSRSENDSPSADLSDMKRQLENTAKMLDRAAEADASRTAEDEALDREMEDLRYRVKRVQEDLEYVSRGPRTSSKDEERRKLERELLKLMHERVPEVERKIEDRERRREREKREWGRERDRRNDRFGKFDAKEERYLPSTTSYRSRDRDEDGRDRAYSRNSYDRDDRDQRDGRDDRLDRGYERPRSPPVARSPPPPPPPPAPAVSASRPPPVLPKTAAPPNTKNMTPEERQAYLQQRINSRMQALGLNVPGPSSTLDSAVEDRLAQEKKEAEEKALQAERQAEERERVRRERLDSEKFLKEGRITPAPAPAPTPTVTASAPAPVPTPTVRPTPTKTRAPAPPPPKKAPRPPASRTPVVQLPPPPPPPAPVAAPPPPVAAPAPPPVPEVDPEEEQFRAREEALRKQREARAERLRQLEQEEEEARRAEEEYQKRRAAFSSVKYSTPPSVSPAPPPPVAAQPPPVAAQPPPVAAQPPPVAAPTPPPPPPAPPVAPTPSTAEKSSTNPFSRLMKEGGTSAPATPPSAPTVNGGNNPFFRSQTAPPGPPLSKSPTPAVVKTSYHTAPGKDDDDWDDEIVEKDEDDSSDDEITSSRNTRTQIAQQLFGSILPPARPQSAAAGTAPVPMTTPPAPPPPPPPAPVSAIPSAPAPPVAPSAPPAPVAPAVGDVSALMQSIQGGLKLKKAQTNDRSAAPLSGRVLGDNTPPAHINAAPRPASPPITAVAVPMSSGIDSTSSNRQSVDWYAGLAADERTIEHLPATAEEDERGNGGGDESHTTVPDIHLVAPAGEEQADPMADVDKSIETRVRSLYAYEGQRPSDLSFGENLIIVAHPSKSGGDWWHGTLARDGTSGFFPKTYVQAVKQVKARALYTYSSNGADELSFVEGEELSVVDTSEGEWWKAEEDGEVFIIPAAYVEVVEVDEKATLRLTDGIVAASQQPEALHTPDFERSPTRGNDDAGIVGDDESDYTDDSDDSDSEESDEQSNEAREHERQLVLEAAGLIVNQEVKPPPNLLRRRSTRRPAPVAPQRSSIISNASTKELPQIPEPQIIDHATRLDDAFDRYEAFRHANGNLNRMSVASITSSETTPPSPGVSAVSLASSPRDSGYSNLLNFLGRKAPVNEAEKRTMPTISAPIMSPSTPSRENSPAFGTSWASLVDRAALEEIPVRERHRQEIIFELITTEAAYVRDLQLIVEVFYSTMLPLLDRKAVTVVFANVEEILLVNTTFLSSLEDRQKECRLYIDNIGDILQTHMSNMGVYTEYCVNQGTAIKVLQSLRDSNPALASHLQQLRDDPNVRSLDLSSYLLVPMQRLTRYPLLIRQILNHTDDTVEDRTAIKMSLDIAEQILNHINESIREQEGRERLKDISQYLWIGQGRLDLTAPTRHMGLRRLLKEGMLLKAKSGRKLRAFLCSDILVLTDGATKTLYRMPIPLADVKLRDASSGKDDAGFEIELAYPRGGGTTGLRGTSVRDCHSWIEALNTAIRKCRDAEKRALRKAQKG